MTGQPTIVLRALVLGLVLAGCMAPAPAQAVSPRAGGATDRADSVRACHDRYLDLYRQDATAFDSAAECRRYAAAGWELVHLTTTITGSFGSVKGHWVLSEDSGYGLLPGSDVSKCGILPSGASACQTIGTIAIDGTYAGTSGMHFDEFSGWVPDKGTFFCFNPYITPSYVTGIYLVATTASGSTVQSRTVPTNCRGPI